MSPVRIISLLTAFMLFSACGSSVFVQTDTAADAQLELAATTPADAPLESAATTPADATVCPATEAEATFRLLGPDDAVSSEVWDLNNAGVAVGSFRLPNDSVVARGAIWQPDGSFAELLVGDVTLLYGINNAGTVVGRDNVGRGTRSFVVEPGGEPEWFMVENSTATNVDEINDRGQAAGAYFFDGHRQVGGFVREPSGQIDTFTTPGAMIPNLVLNNRGEVSGTYELDGETYGFVRSPGGEVTAFQLGDGGSADSVNIRDLSDIGELVGYEKSSRTDVGFRRANNGVITYYEFGDSNSFRASAIDAAGNVVGTAADSGLIVRADGSMLRFVSPDGPLSVTAMNDSLAVAGAFRGSKGFEAFRWSPGLCPDE